ncbi:hypothetical protein Q361_1333 [Flavobacterium croceum DSM 17960]|uniref:Uncharacterized protein n=1 Tax=Flavobacterium croceum DSM 17960 TaxID=1121886 RepID=A0A2S4N4J9_9FLAO|nr:hypothetical protein [Flavobacterium croceum]POS00664.1 hypothetical protein Q361_1333 [Flavobacterium croceum DSM 17960]
MKKVLFVGLLLAVSYVGFSQTSDKSVENKSVMCQLYRVFIGDDSAGCGGGERVCCANTNLNFA